MNKKSNYNYSGSHETSSYRNEDRFFDAPNRSNRNINQDQYPGQQMYQSYRDNDSYNQNYVGQNQNPQQVHFAQNNDAKFYDPQQDQQRYNRSVGLNNDSRGSNDVGYLNNPQNHNYPNHLNRSSNQDYQYSQNTNEQNNRSDNQTRQPMQNDSYYDRQESWNRPRSAAFRQNDRFEDSQNYQSGYSGQQEPQGRNTYRGSRNQQPSYRSMQGGRISGGFQGQHYGQSPKGFNRSDERIQEEICENLTRAGDIDKSDIEVKVKDGEVILSGTVDSKWEKRQVEDICDDVMGVRNTQNNLKLSTRDSYSSSNTTTSSKSSASKNK